MADVRKPLRGELLIDLPPKWAAEPVLLSPKVHDKGSFGVSIRLQKTGWRYSDGFVSTGGITPPEGTATGYQLVPNQLEEL